MRGPGLGANSASIHHLQARTQRGRGAGGTGRSKECGSSLWQQRKVRLERGEDTEREVSTKVRILSERVNTSQDSERKRSQKVRILGERDQEKCGRSQKMRESIQIMSERGQEK